MKHLDHWSPSQDTSWNRCPYFWARKRGYLGGEIKEPMPHKVWVGSTCHRVAEKQNKHKLRERENLSIEEINESVIDTYGNPNDDYMDDDTKYDGIVDRMIAGVDHFMETHAFHVQPESVEHKKELRIADTKIICINDLSTESTIHEYKFNCKTPQAGHWQSWYFLQWFCQQMLEPEKEFEFRYTSMLKTKINTTRQQPEQKVDDLMPVVEDELGKKFDMIDRGLFPRRLVNDWACRSCVLKDECKR